MDAVYKAITKLRAAFHEPDAIVLHPTDWQTIRLAKDSNGQFLAAGVIESDPDRLFGIQVIVSPVIAQGTGLVGAFAEGGAWYDREQARITFPESGALGSGGNEIFSRNQVVFRGEERGTLAVIRPAAFCTVTGL